MRGFDCEIKKYREKNACGQPCIMGRAVRSSRAVGEARCRLQFDFRCVKLIKYTRQRSFASLGARPNAFCEFAGRKSGIVSLFMFLLYRLSMAFLLAYLVLFLPRRYPPAVNAMIVLLSFLATTLIDDITFFRAGESMLLLFTAAQIVITQLTVFALCRYRDFRALFTGLSGATFVLTGNVLGMVVYHYSESILLSLLVAAVTHAVFLVLFVVFLRRDFFTELENANRGWGLLCTVPMLFYTTMYLLCIWPSSLAATPSNTMAALYLLVLKEATYLLIFRLFARQRAEAELQRNNDCLEAYAAHLKHEETALQAEQEQTAILRHDLRHYLSSMAAYLDAGETGKLRDALGGLSARLEATAGVRYCENLAVNGVLRTAAALAQQTGVVLTTHLDVPARLPVSEFEFATVLSNLLENAIHAAAEVPEVQNRTVHAAVQRVQGKLLVEISNPCVGSLSVSPETGLPLSQGGAGHGLGLRSVLAFAKKHNALFDYAIENNIFFARLLL